MKKLRRFLEQNKIPYKISYGGDKKDNINIEINDIAIIKEKGNYIVTNISTMNFKWFNFAELKQYILNTN